LNPAGRLRDAGFFVTWYQNTTTRTVLAPSSRNRCSVPAGFAKSALPSWMIATWLFEARAAGAADMRQSAASAVAIATAAEKRGLSRNADGVCKRIVQVTDSDRQKLRRSARNSALRPNRP
jgi:hypothetical protein